MPSKRKIIAESIPLAWALIRRQLMPISVLFLAGCFFQFTMEDSIAGVSPDDSSRWMVQLIMAALSVVQELALMVILSHGIYTLRAHPRPGFLENPFARPYIGTFLAEYLRMLAQILLWSLLLIIPGMIVYLRLIFVPFIALFSKTYAEGQEDALSLSRQLYKKYSWHVIWLLSLGMTPAFIFSLLNYFSETLHAQPMRTVLVAASTLFTIWNFSMIYLIFETALVERTQNVPEGK